MAMEIHNYNNPVKFLYKHYFHHFNNNQPTNNCHNYETDKNQ